MFVARKKVCTDTMTVHCSSILSVVGLGSVGTATCTYTGADFMEIGQIFHNKHIFNIIIELSKLKSGKWFGQCFLFPISGHLMLPCDSMTQS